MSNSPYLDKTYPRLSADIKTMKHQLFREVLGVSILSKGTLSLTLTPSDYPEMSELLDLFGLRWSQHKDYFFREYEQGGGKYLTIDLGQAIVTMGDDELIAQNIANTPTTILTLYYNSILN